MNLNAVLLPLLLQTTSSIAVTSLMIKKRQKSM